METFAEADASFVMPSLMDPEVIEEPYSCFNRLREHSAVYWDPGSNAWLVSSYTAVSEVLRQPKLFASDRATFYSHYLPAQKKDLYDIVFHVYPKWMAGNDPPVHDHMRRIVNTNWTPAKVQNLRAQVRETISGLLDALSTDEPIDLVRSFAVPLPAIIISSVIGIPPEHWTLIKEWTDDWGRLHFSPGNDVELWDRGAGALKEFYTYVASRLGERKNGGGNDYFARAIEAQFDGDRLSDDEITVHIIEQLFAGHETTTNLIGNGVLLLMRNRDQWERLCADPSLASSTVEEVLRYEGPVKMITRWARQDCELGGRKIREGDNILLLLAAGNRDPRQFEQPEQFDVGRSPNHHLTFGQGIHFCLGAPLARLEGEEVFRALATRYPRLVLSPGKLQHRPIMRARALESLHVKLGSPAAPMRPKGA
jgi:cytochrome P450